MKAGGHVAEARGRMSALMEAAARWTDQAGRTGGAGTDARMDLLIAALDAAGHDPSAASIRIAPHDGPSDGWWRTPLSIAIEAGDVDHLVDRLLAAGADPTAVMRQGPAAGHDIRAAHLLHGSVHGRHGLVARCLDHDPEAADAMHDPGHRVVGRGPTPFVQHLIQHAFGTACGEDIRLMAVAASRSRRLHPEPSVVPPDPMLARVAGERAVMAARLGQDGLAAWSATIGAIAGGIVPDGAFRGPWIGRAAGCAASLGGHPAAMRILASLGNAA